MISICFLLTNSPDPEYPEGIVECSYGLLRLPKLPDSWRSDTGNRFWSGRISPWNVRIILCSYICKFHDVRYATWRISKNLWEMSPSEHRKPVPEWSYNKSLELQYLLWRSKIAISWRLIIHHVVYVLSWFFFWKCPPSEHRIRSGLASSCR